MNEFGTGNYQPYIINEKVHVPHINVEKLMDRLIDISHAQAKQKQHEEIKNN